LFVGQWLDNKGRHWIVEAFTQLREKWPAVSLSILGTGVPVDDVLHWFPVGIRSAVSVRQHVCDRELIHAYANHGILLLPSYFEAWGLVLLEAAAAGMAIVATQTGGPSDLIASGENGLLVPRADVRALVSAVESLLLNQEERRRLGTNAREAVRLYTWRAAAESQLAAYERALEVARTQLDQAPPIQRLRARPVRRRFPRSD
jgi:glycosyltransferase involved in cell wall biosynthesis